MYTDHNIIFSFKQIFGYTFQFILNHLQIDILSYNYQRMMLVYLLLLVFRYILQERAQVYITSIYHKQHRIYLQLIVVYRTYEAYRESDDIYWSLCIIRWICISMLGAESLIHFRHIRCHNLNCVGTSDWTCRNSSVGRRRRHKYPQVDQSPSTDIGISMALFN